MNTLNAILAASIIYSMYYCLHVLYKRRPVDIPEPDMNADFDKIFRCVDSCIHFKQLYACDNLITAFEKRHPNNEYRSTMLCAFILYRERVLISKYSSLETMLGSWEADLDCEIAVEAAREILEKGGKL